MADDELLDRSSLRQLFDACDPSGSGFISKQSLLDGCQRLHLDDLTAQDVDVLFSKLATNEDGDSGKVSFEAFVEQFAAWAADQQSCRADDGHDELDGAAVEAASRHHNHHQKAEESFEGVSHGPPSSAHPHDSSHGAAPQQALSESDLDELVRRFDADTSGVSLRNALVSRWQLTDSEANTITSALNIHMSEANIKQVIGQSLLEFGIGVPQAVVVQPADLAPVILVDKAGDSPILHRPSYDVSPSASPNLMRRGSIRARSGSFRGGVRPAVARNVTLDEASIGDLKYHGEVRQLWENMKASQPELLDGFASFLDGISQQLQDAERQKEQLKTDLARETRDLDQRAMQLDEEATQQIEVAKAKAKEEEHKRLRHVRENLLKEVQERDQRLENAMEDLNSLQGQVHKLSAKGKTMETQYEEMEKMKASLEKALEAQRAKHEELQQQLSFSASEHESSSRPVSAGPNLSGSEHEILSRHIESLHVLNMNLRLRLQDRADELELSGKFQRRISPCYSVDGESSYGSDHRAHQQAIGSSSPSVYQTRKSKSRYTSDEDALSGPGHRTHNSPFDRSARHRRSGSFRRSGKRQRGAGASPRITPRSGIGESKASAAAEFGDDEGSPVENSPEARPKPRAVVAMSSDSDSDLQVDERQEVAAGAHVHKSPSPRRSSKTKAAFTDSETVRTSKQPVRRTSLSPDDLVPGYSPDHNWSLPGQNTPIGIKRANEVLQETVAGADTGPLARSTPSNPALRGEKLSDVLGDSPAHIFTPPVEINVTDAAAEVTPSVLEAAAAASATERVIPLASVQPVQEKQHAHHQERPAVKGRSLSMRVKSRHNRTPAGSRGGGTGGPQPWTEEVSDRLDLSSTKPVNMPAVVHPIKLNPAKHSTVQFPITSDLVNEVGGVTPDRVFKVVFCGDSGVGKTSYIWRICNQEGDFQPSSFSSTIGVEFQTKLLEIDGQQTVLQLWDTAGQERFRSFTKQYFRKADGVIVMYDICSDQSFMNVREWIAQLQEATGESTAVMLLGNKVDLADVRPRPRRKVTYWQAQQLAQQSNALFAEVSAKSGHNIMETCYEMTKILLAAEKETMDGLLKLNTNDESAKEKKKSCCI